MGKSEVLARVATDLERGHTHLAQQRLASLAVNHPDDLDLRLRRAAVYRRVGDWTQAGRWGFLAEDAPEAELAAFERAYPSPVARLGALRLTREPPRGLGPRALDRYLGLAERARAERRVPQDDDSGLLTCFVVTGGLLLVALLLGVGLWTSVAFVLGKVF
ncbi:hypothetical protein Aab01nite_01310 [Paractinoplanes abujensis]|uniref:Uncharacterized protein n=1 Tax=Paractinoplanes abujensis TaxID=882441 RepID=A0A7W7CP08_9ACTN|nr:DUF6584 family protein [Actinoplanes abujensis]MBB4692042.1 hypothetical protein [Actinoplanes abujensis]GID16541.1 hypothetical protein Aab01nite_01310 [Actinoplanes abujensis]